MFKYFVSSTNYDLHFVCSDTNTQELESDVDTQGEGVVKR